MSTFSTLSPPHKKRRCRTLCSALARAKNNVAQIHCRKVVAFCSATCYNMPCPWGYSSVGRALEWHSRGQGFDSPYLHQRFELRLKAIQRTGSSAQMPLPFSLARTLPRSPLRSDNGHRNRDGSLRSPIPSSLRSSLRLPFTMVSPSAQRSDCSGLFFFRRGQMAEIRGQLPCCSFRNGVGAAVLSVITASDAAVFAVRRPLKTCIFTHKNVRIRPLNIRLCWISYYTTHTQYTIPIILV